MNWYTNLDVLEKILSALVAAITLITITWAALRQFRPQFTLDLQKVLFRSTCIPLGTGPSRIFHMQWPYILPICLKNPKRQEYVYMMIGKKPDDERELIVTVPRIPAHSISSIPAGITRWYQLTTDLPLQSISFGESLQVDSFKSIEAEIYPMGTWNKSYPVTVPKNKTRAYALAITEQYGSSNWFVSINDNQFIFNQNFGCHLIEFVLPKNQNHNLALGYNDGGYGIACAFFAF
jgi:hypothetical protein